ncbi:putative glutaredoxin [Aedoeadaptatus nemausensis]|uniref:Putative glutaredoxin n=1 Tax=Aedoeadaptatus nemausensis TaxID=2582829 RepID=A0A6V6Y4E2_9FIRM|nr:glutaredoxin [Peptoniphilus nemausensis]CAC9932044.1 putative glutaredoxin [Peptoniphilus nemausensis]
MIRLYETPLCPDCIEAEKKLKEKKIVCEQINITETITNLKEFMKLRDENAAFDEIKNKGQIGVPAFLKEDGRVVFSVDEL